VRRDLSGTKSNLLSLKRVPHFSRYDAPEHRGFAGLRKGREALKEGVESLALLKRDLKENPDFLLNKGNFHTNLGYIAFVLHRPPL